MCATAVHPEQRVEVFCVPTSAYRKIAAPFGRGVVEYDAQAETMLLPALMNDVSWEQYETLLETLSDHRMWHTYDQGTLEMMSSSPRHERIKIIIARLIEMLTLEFDISIKSVGSTTLRRAASSRGLEPHESYFIAHEALMRGKRDYDLDRDPPPDLVVEVDIQSAVIDRMPVFAALGVPEIWRHDGESNLSFHRLTRGEYESIERSEAFPFLAPDDVSRFVDQRQELDENSLVRSFLNWVRAKQAKRPQAPKKKDP